MTKRTYYVIVENAGYEGENVLDVKYNTFRDARYSAEYQWYTAEERETLHVEIAQRLPDGSLRYLSYWNDAGSDEQGTRNLYDM